MERYVLIIENDNGRCHPFVVSADSPRTAIVNVYEKMCNEPSFLRNFKAMVKVTENAQKIQSVFFDFTGYKIIFFSELRGIVFIDSIRAKCDATANSERKDE